MAKEMMVFIGLGFLPGLMWLVYFYCKDRIEPEPKGHVFLAYVLGGAVIFPAIACEMPFRSMPFMVSVLVAPVIEEAFKFLVVGLYFYRSADFDEPLDGIIYAVSVALGFASIENAGYLYKASQLGHLEQVFVLRSLLSVPAHALFACVWGFALGCCKFRLCSRAIVGGSLVLAMLSHAVFNFAAFMSLGGAVILLSLMTYLWGRAHHNIQVSLKNSPHNTEEML